MQLSHSQVNQYLKNNKDKIHYLILGNEPFLGQDTAKNITKYARKNGFIDRRIFYLKNKFNQPEIINELCSTGLFNSKKVIEIRFDQDSFPKKEGEKLIKALQRNNQHLIIIQASTLNYKTQKDKWLHPDNLLFSIIKTDKIYPNQVGNWIKQRADQYHIQLQNEATQTIVDLSKGNLLWSEQILKHLKLLYPNTLITNADIKDILSDSSVYQLVDLTKSILHKSKSNIYYILQKLRAENISPVLVTAVLKKEIEILLLIKSHNNNIENITKRFGIWQSQQQSYLHASQSYTIEILKSIFTQIAQIDRMNKGIIKGCPWTAINQIAYKITCT